MTGTRWHVLAVVGSTLAACAHPQPPPRNYFFPTADEPYRVSLQENPERKTVTITVLLGPRGRAVELWLYGVDREGSEPRTKTVGEREHIIEGVSALCREGLFWGDGQKALGGGVYDPSAWGSWCDKAREAFYGVRLELPFEDLRRYGPVLYLKLSDVEFFSTNATYELHELEPLHAKLQDEYELTDEFKERDRVARHQEQARLERKQEIAKHLAEEVATGRCNAENQNFLQAFLVQQVPVIARVMEHSAVTEIGPHRVVVATDEPATYTFRATLSGLYHVFVVGIEPAPIDEVRDGNGDPASVRSPYTAGALSGGLPMEAVVARAQSWQDIAVTVRGHGCALIFTINEVGR